MENSELKQLTGKLGKDKTMAKLKPPEEMRFEEAFEELAALVEKIESGDLELEESLGLFERGQALADRCSQLLEEAEISLRQLEGGQEDDSEESSDG